jgi:hypothetical protein
VRSGPVRPSRRCCRRRHRSRREWVSDEVQKQSFTDEIGWIRYPSRGLFPNQRAGRVEQFTHRHIDLSTKTGFVGAQSKIRAQQRIGLLPAL